MEKTYQPEQIETRWYERWEADNRFAPSGRGKPFSIMIPPPNVTGSLHMGHAFQDTIMDTLTRWKRMQGNNTLWQVGTDHAGIATQMLVERKIAAEEGKTRHDLGREAFIEKSVGVEGKSPAATLPDSCAAWAPASTGAVSASPWTMASIKRFKKFSCACTKRA
ncbi:hypothetical protein HAALTHF_00950n [Vreelandella aquamarina]|nr:hypothetical protein HAALTHF_00950n [Halomonas axialensis]